MGLAQFTIEARTDNPAFVYVADFEITVAGVQVVIGEQVVSGAFKRGVGLGGFGEWIERRQLALPIRVQQPRDDLGLVPVAERVSLSLVGDGQLIDSVFFDERACMGRAGVTTSPASDSDGSQGNTLFVVGRNNVSLGEVSLPAQCGLAVSDDGQWLVVRLEPYRVSGYRFGVRIDWSLSDDSGSSPTDASGIPLFPTYVVTNFEFNEDTVPPPVILGLNVTLDQFGNEVLRVPVTNVLSPPQNAELRAEDFSLRLESGHRDWHSVPATRIVSPTRAKVMEPNRQLEFITPLWTNQSAQDLRATLFYESRVRIKKFKNNSSPLQQSPDDEVAVVAPGSMFSIRLASAALAEEDACEQDQQTYDTNRFILVELESKHYNASTFSEYKKRQIGNQIGLSLSSLPENGIRFMKVEGTVLRYAILIQQPVTEDELNISLDALEASISDNELSLAVNLEDNTLTKKRIQIVNQSLCQAYASASPPASATDNISGIFIRLLPLWVALAITGATILVASMCLFIYLYLQGKAVPSETLSDFHSSDVPDPELSLTPDGSPSKPTSPSPEGVLVEPFTPDYQYCFTIPVYSGDTASDREVNNMQFGETRTVPLALPSDLDSSTEDAVVQGIVQQVVTGVVESMAVARRWFGRRQRSDSGTSSLSVSESQTPSPQVYMEQVFGHNTPIR